MQKTTKSFSSPSATRVLLIDDDREFSSLLATSLEQLYGYRVHQVSSAYDAMNELLDSHYGLVILDWDLAGMSGFQALNAVDNAMGLEDRLPLHKLDHRTPVVVLSAHDPQKLRLPSREKKHFSIRRVLSKRHEFRTLLEMIGSVTGSGKTKIAV